LGISGALRGLGDFNSRALFENLATELSSKVPQSRWQQECPKCRQAGWQIESSAPDDVFADLGVSTRVYKCTFCGFTESKLSK
jgi:hypothetical protein